MFKKTIVAASLVLVATTSSANVSQNRSMWQYMQETTPNIYGYTYKQKCEELAETMYRISSLRDAGMFKGDIFNMLYTYDSSENWGDGLEMLIESSFLYSHVHPIDAGNRIETRCKGAER